MVNKKRIKIDSNKDGVTIWVNGTWVLDASCFSTDKTVRIDTQRMMNIESNTVGQTEFKLIDKNNDLKKKIKKLEKELKKIKEEVE